MSWTGGSDVGSGLASKQLLQRQRAAVTTPGSCSGLSYANDGEAALLSNGSIQAGLLDRYCYRWRLTTLDRVGNRALPVISGRVLVDATAPVVDFAGPNEGTNRLQATAGTTVSWKETEAGGSGLASRALQRQRGAIVIPGRCTGVNWSNDGGATAAVSPVSVTGLLSGYCYRWQQTLRDRAGNTAVATSGALLIDTSAPSTPHLTAWGANAYQRAPNGTIYFRGGVSGRLTLYSSADDPQSGVTSTSFGSVSGSGWTSSAGTVWSNPATRTATWSSTAGNGSISVTVRNGVGKASSVRVGSIVRDATPPEAAFVAPGESLGWAGGYYTISWRASDEGAGPDPLARLQRQRAPIAADGTCAGTTWAIDGESTYVSSPAVSRNISGGYCYRWWLTVADQVGNARRVLSAPVIADVARPVVSDLSASLSANSYLGTNRTAPVALTWSGTDSGSGLVVYELQQSTNGGEWTDLPLTSPLQTIRSVRVVAGTAYAFRVRAMDAVGNWSGWRTTALRSSILESSDARVTYSSGWKTQYLSSASGGGVRYATAARSTATFAFDGRSVAWVAPVGLGRGRAHVYLDGAYAATIDLGAASYSPRRTVYTASWGVDGPHKLRIVVLGTSGRPRVDVDAFVVLRAP